MISCLPDQPRYIGDQDVFTLLEWVVEDIMAAAQQAAARSVAAVAGDPIQQTVIETVKDAIRRRTVDRNDATEQRGRNNGDIHPHRGRLTLGE